MAALQNAVDPVTTPLAGEIVVGVITVGAVFSTLTLAEEVAEALAESVAVAVHVIDAPTLSPKETV
mgnify:CR=1 FL=1